MSSESLVRPASQATGKSLIVKFVIQRELLLIAVSVGISLILGALHPDFLSISNLDFILLNAVVLGLISIGQTFVIISKGIDLSVAPIMGLTALVTGLMSVNQGLPLWAAILLAIAIGAILGAVNGVFISFAHIPPIIVTLGTLSIYGGFMFLYSNGVQVTSVPPAYAAFGNGLILPGVPFPVLLLALFTLLGWFVLKYTPFGRKVYAIGNNQESAHNAGIPVRKILFLVYVLCGALAGFAGLVYISYTAAATATTGVAENVELQSVAAVLIGGTLITGGQGSVVGSVIGSIFLTLLLAVFVFLRIPAIWDPAGEGLLILLAVILNIMLISRHTGTATEE
ncbi:MAG TPA: ABC transporter permease [Ktedonobacteraceae bacterium]|jgi:ribose/xylose/arabinose/galactoside ABC-type transport system permease subunit|nr:ABC transporter permease [Ktedonobacteraceae bacterium]